MATTNAVIVPGRWLHWKTDAGAAAPSYADNCAVVDVPCFS